MPQMLDLEKFLQSTMERNDEFRWDEETRTAFEDYLRNHEGNGDLTIEVVRNRKKFAPFHVEEFLKQRNGKTS